MQNKTNAKLKRSRLSPGMSSVMVTAGRAAATGRARASRGAAGRGTTTDHRSTRATLGGCLPRNYTAGKRLSK